MNRTTLFTLLLALGTTTMVWADNDYDDDIYYNPNQKKQKTEKKKPSAYIADFGSIDVDTYNRRGEQYYATPVDTIGERIGTDPDFVYTQQIQKFINPTIVVDNADALADVLNNSYGNVEIVIENGTPLFTPVYTYSLPYYSYTWGAPYWSGYWGPSWSWTWGWGPSWTWGPSWSWNWGWGPSWAWGPSWGWGWGPSWGWGGGWYPGHSHRYWANHYRPHSNRRPNHPQSGWAHNGGGNYNGGYGHRPGGGGSHAVTGSTTGNKFNTGMHRVDNGSSTIQSANTNLGGRVPNGNRGSFTRTDNQLTKTNNQTVNGMTVNQMGTSKTGITTSRTNNRTNNRTVGNAANGTLTKQTGNRINGTSTYQVNPNRNSNATVKSGTIGGNSRSNSFNRATSTPSKSTTTTPRNNNRTYNSNTQSRSYNNSNSRSSGNSFRSSGGSFGGSRSSGGSFGGGRSGGGSRGGGGGRHR